NTVEVSNSVDIGNEVVSSGERPCELDLQVLPGLANTNAVVLCEALEELDPLLQHTIPSCALGVFEGAVFVKSPFSEQRGCRVLPPKVSRQGLFERSAEEHCCSSVLLPPSVEIAMPVAARTTEVLADLGKAVRHQATSGLAFFGEVANDNSSH